MLLLFLIHDGLVQRKDGLQQRCDDLILQIKFPVYVPIFNLKKPCFTHNVIC